MKISSITKDIIIRESRSKPKNTRYSWIVRTHLYVFRKMLHDLTLLRLKNQYYENHERL